MSLQRACVNCERCYNLAQIDAKTRYTNLYDNDLLYEARNEAMKALEHVTDTIPFSQAKEMNPSPGVIAFKALQACSLCDYSSPKIVETVENLSNPKKKE